MLQTLRSRIDIMLCSLLTLFSVEEIPHLYHASERILVESNSCKSRHYFKVSTAVHSIISITRRYRSVPIIVLVARGISPMS